MRDNVNRFLRLVLTCAVLVVSHSVMAEAATGQDEEPGTPPSAEQQVELFHATLLRTARLEGDYDARVALLGDTFDAVFDLQRIARISAGAAWRTLDTDTKDRYLTLLRDVILGTYVSRFDADRGQRFEMLGAEEVKPGRDLVNARIVRATGAPVALSYYLRDQRVFNVEADGVSDLSVRRADYTDLIKSAGFEALLEYLSQQRASSRNAFSSGR